MIAFAATTATLCTFALLLYAAFLLNPTLTALPVQPPVIAARDNLYGVAAVASGSAWAVGSGGKIVHASEVGPATLWTSQPSGVEVNLQAIDAWDSNRAVAVGNEGIVVVTGDGGASWTRAKAPVSAVANKLVRVRTLADGSAYAVGEYNAILRSNDFALSWERLTPERDIAWYGLDVSGRTLLVVGELGRALISRDAGKTFRPVQTPTKAHLTGVAFKSDLEAVAVGLNGAVLHTRDGGTAWQLSSVSIEAHVYDVIWDGRRYIACGERGLLMASPDGEAWRVLDTRLGPERNSLWFTQIRKWQSGYLVAGSTLAVFDGARFYDLATPAPGSPLALVH